MEIWYLQTKVSGLNALAWEREGSNILTLVLVNDKTTSKKWRSLAIHTEKHMFPFDSTLHIDNYVAKSFWVKRNV